MNYKVDPLSGAREIASDVFVFTSGAYALNSCVVLGSPASSAPRQALVVDPAYFPAEIERIAAFLSSRGAEASRIVLTHSDWDHIVGPARWPGASVVASWRFPQRAASDGKRIATALLEFDRRLYVDRAGAFAIPLPDTLVGSPSDLVWDGPPVHFLPAGGHTTDGLMALLRRERVLVAGDHLSDREIPFVGDSIDGYQKTLAQARRIVAAGEAEILVPGHGAICGRDGILERIEEDADYLSRLDGWVRETRRTVDTVEGILERCDEVVFRKGADNPDVRAEHRSNVALLARAMGIG